MQRAVEIKAGPRLPARLRAASTRGSSTIAVAGVSASAMRPRGARRGDDGFALDALEPDPWRSGAREVRDVAAF